MNAVSSDAEVRWYVHSVREQLDDLPEAERNDLTQDLEQHLTEVAAEGEGSLTERLGPPREYAAELRTSAGLPPGSRRASPLLGQVWEVARLDVRTGARRLAELPRVRPALSFLDELKPGWWVLRGGIAVAALVFVLTDARAGQLPVPKLGGSRILTLLAVAAGIWVSVRFGRAAGRPSHARRLSWVFNLLTVVAAVVLASSLPYPESRTIVTSTPYLNHEDGVSIQEICPYAEDGTLLEGVLLFAQDGRPIVNVNLREYHWYADRTRTQIHERTPGNVYPRRLQRADGMTILPCADRIGGEAPPPEPVAPEEDPGAHPEEPEAPI